MSKGTKSVKKAVEKTESVSNVERTISLKPTVQSVVSAYKEFKQECLKLEGKADKETFELSFKSLDRKVARLNNKAMRNDVLKALRDGKTVTVIEPSAPSEGNNE